MGIDSIGGSSAKQAEFQKKEPVAEVKKKEEPKEEVTLTESEPSEPKEAPAAPARAVA